MQFGHLPLCTNPTLQYTFLCCGTGIQGFCCCFIDVIFSPPFVLYAVSSFICGMYLNNSIGSSTSSLQPKSEYKFCGDFMFCSFCYNCVELGSGVLTESAVIIWKQKTDQDAPDFPSGDTDNATKEQWLGIRVLRGHMEDIYDLSWSPDSLNLISGSVDNSAIIWDVHKGI